ncbi:MAG TPA: pyrimidine dimer DNA glycosylase/endonuclease V [Usitatibacter sp.]|nr:pyrimidine dimer DNA glycosylase/endonuclease V [Usitatibacter sp.]
MRLWSLHPRYLDPQGLVALWREALLAREVLRGNTRGYRFHPQLERFRECAAPLSAINAYLRAVHAEAAARGYAFDASKLARVAVSQRLRVTDGQLAYEWKWLLRKLRARNPALHAVHRRLRAPQPHPLFRVARGGVADWERRTDAALPLV